MGERVRVRGNLISFLLPLLNKDGLAGFNRYAEKGAHEPQTG
jgi:hypothetical protein